MYKSSIILLAFISIIRTGYSQLELTTSEIKNYLLLKDYKTLAKFAQLEDKNTQLIITKKKIEINYTVNKKTGKLEVFEDVTDQFYAIGNYRYNLARSVHTDENKELIKVSKLRKQGSSHNVRYECSDVQSNDIFYSGAQSCNYVAQVPYQYGDYINVNPATYIQKSRYLDARYMALNFLVDNWPIMDLEIIINIPYGIDADVIAKNFKDLDLKLTKTNQTKSKSVRYVCQGYNLPAALTDRNILGPTHIYPYIIFVPKTYNAKEEKITMFNSLDGLYAWYHKLSEETDNKPSTLKPLVKKLTANKTSDIEKAKAIFYWVQDNIRYIAFEDGLAGFRPAACNDVFQKKYGDCKGMANLTKEMLQLAGIDGRLTWLGTNRLATDYTIPTLASDNHMICSATLNGKRYFMDPTEKYISFNDYAERIQGRPVLIENGKTYLIDTIPSFDETRNEIRRVQKLKVTGTHLKGTLNQQFKGEGKVELMRLYNNNLGNRKTKVIDYLINRGDDNIKIVSHNKPNFSERDKPLIISSTVDITNKILKFDNDLYIEFDQFKSLQNSNIDTTRKSDINNHSKTHKVDIVEITLPTSYKVSHLPDNLNVFNNSFSLQITFKKVRGKIIYKKVMKILLPTMQHEDFKAWNDMTEKLNKSIYKNMIVLTKK